MNEGEWTKIVTLYDEAMQLRTGPRVALIEEIRKNDAESALELERLVFGHTTCFLESTAIDARWEAGDTIANYELVQKVGEGGMGVVFHARLSTPVERIVALKAVTSTHDRSAQQRFWMEQQGLASVDHPNVIKLLDSGITEDGVAYLTTELLDGLTFHEHCLNHDLSVADRLGLVVGVCSGLQHVHDSGVIHRDLKATNVVIHKQHGEWIPKIVDFGVALLRSRGTQRVTRAFEVVGTPAVMSPEQAKPRADVDERADIYSLGVLLRDAIERTAPDKADPAAITLRDKGLQIASKASADEPEARFATASELEDALRRLLGWPISAPKAVPSQPMRWAAMGFLILSVFITSGGARFGATNWKVHLLQEVIDVEEGKAELDSFWPLTAADVPGLRDWLDRYGQYANSIAEYERTRDTSQHDPVLVSAYENLKAFYNGPDLSKAEEMLQTAEGIAAAQRDAKEPWREAIAAVRTHPRYAGHVLSIEPSLVPLGPDPESGLWEFWHPASGMRPERATDGRWEIRADTGMVFVLLPAGAFVAGEQELTGAEFDWSPDGPLVANVFPNGLDKGFRVGDLLVRTEAEPRATVARFILNRGDAAVPISIPITHLRQRGLPFHSVRFTPFYLSKYETTQRQCGRVMELPAQRPRHSYHDDPYPVDAGQRPVSGLLMSESREAMRRLGLEMPTDLEWEYAARAGTTSATWVGNTVQDIRDAGIANLNNNEYDDGWWNDSPVGIFEPNPWGLHDVLGNSGEWVRLAVPNEWNWTHHIRGGTCGKFAADTHAAQKYDKLPSNRIRPRAGFRPVIRPRN